MQGEYINGQVWKYLEQQNKKITARILTALDYDIAQFVRYYDEIHIEKTYSGAYIPNYLFDYIKRHEQNIIAAIVKGEL